MRASIRPYTNVLRKAGFVKESEDVHIVVFEKMVDSRRRVEVQLWKDGGYRACHSVDGCSDTRPTDFKTVSEMVHAIEIESTRTDNGWLATGKKEWPKGDVMVVLPDGAVGIVSGEDK